mmetsp:Transcript_71003/g.154304  ORF Transcript_71003/g.154304 Transcript_71003/m.154304 type:complete len:210 (+) Transcript_71003:2500-3129(+)
MPERGEPMGRTCTPGPLPGRLCSRTPPRHSRLRAPPGGSATRRQRQEAGSVPRLIATPGPTRRPSQRHCHRLARARGEAKARGCRRPGAFRRRCFAIGPDRRTRVRPIALPCRSDCRRCYCQGHQRAEKHHGRCHCAPPTSRGAPLHPGARPLVWPPFRVRRPSRLHNGVQPGQDEARSLEPRCLPSLKTRQTSQPAWRQAWPRAGFQW